VTTNARAEVPEDDPDYAEAAELWNAMTQRDRTTLLLLVLRMNRVIDAQELGAGGESRPPE
jgi:hypothetical protein